MTHHEHHAANKLQIPSTEAFLAKHGDKSGLKFPCNFPVKIFGLNDGDFLNYAYNLILPHAPETKLEDCRTNSSSKGRYIAVTINIKAVSREQLDTIYGILKDDPKVKAML